MMLHAVGFLALALMAQEPGQWQDFGAAADGSHILVNLDSIEAGELGPEAMVRVRYARPTAAGVTQVDMRSIFDCQARRVRRFVTNEISASGEISARTDEGQPIDPVQAPAGTPMGRVLDLVCATTQG